MKNNIKNNNIKTALLKGLSQNSAPSEFRKEIKEFIKAVTGVKELKKEWYIYILEDRVLIRVVFTESWWLPNGGMASGKDNEISIVLTSGTYINIVDSYLAGIELTPVTKFVEGKEFDTFIFYENEELYKTRRIERIKLFDWDYIYIGGKGFEDDNIN